MSEVCALVRSLPGIRVNPLKANPIRMRRRSHRQFAEGEQVAFGSRDVCIGARRSHPAGFETEGTSQYWGSSDLQLEEDDRIYDHDENEADDTHL